MEDRRGSFSLIVAGYTDEMQQFIKSNPGLDSRFDNKFVFHDFNENELWKIAENMFQQKSLVVDEESEKHLKIYIHHLYENRNRFFGNARSIRKIVEKVVRNQELRMADLPKSQRTQSAISTVILNDVKEFVFTKTQQNLHLVSKFHNNNGLLFIFKEINGFLIGLSFVNFIQNEVNIFS
jgi:hypothetical protein